MPSYASLIRRPRAIALCASLLALIFFPNRVIFGSADLPVLWHGTPAPPSPPPPSPITITRTIQSPQTTVTITVASPPIPTRKVEKPLLLNGPPTTRFQDNLRPELKYISTWPGSGFTNDVMAYINLLYLAKSTSRVAIIPAFDPTHVVLHHLALGLSYFPANLDFGEAFDIPRFTELSGVHVVDWSQVKDSASESVDPLGCWNLWQAVSTQHTGPHYTKAEEVLKLDISYTLAPRWIKQYPEMPENEYMRLSSLVALSYPLKHKETLLNHKPVKSTALGVEIPPDQHLLCYDSLFWACDNEAHDMIHDYSSAWQQVGQYLHFNPKVERIAREYLRKMFSLTTEQPIAPYISVHARRTDFGQRCTIPVEECFAPLSAFAKRVKQMQARLLAEKGIFAERVVMTSDETSEAWWADVASYGWVRPDHTSWATVKEYGAWYPILVDGAIHAMGHGLVGTEDSTVSMISGRRVESWNDGLSYLVKWGRPNMDDEE
ncbi:hypothetical protein C8F01DRAFT_613161 [Mycena amicta]|nr:hypothetical protein C8F01DRAFT_613161 [Mycena amicta]